MSKRFFVSLIFAFIFSIGYAQVNFSYDYEEGKWNIEINDYDEFLTKPGYIYDEVEGKALANVKRQLLHQALFFYNKQVDFVIKWIEKGKCSVSKINFDKYSCQDDKMIESILFIKTFYLNQFEENLDADVKEILNNEKLMSEYRKKMKADKSYLPVINSFKDRLLKERVDIASTINKEDSLVLLFNATKNNYIGLWYIDKHVCGGHMNFNWIPELENKKLNMLPEKMGEVKYKNPNYDPAEKEWAWLHSNDYQNVRTSYPIEEVYKKYSSHPEYKVKTIDKRTVVYMGDKVVYIGEGKDDNKSKLIRQVCIHDYQNNKYDIKNSSSSLLAKIDEMLIEGRDRAFYVGAELYYNYAKQAYEEMVRMQDNHSIGGVLMNTLTDLPKLTEEDKAEIEAKFKEAEAKLEKAKQLESDPEFRTAEKYIKQLTSDRENLTFKGKRLDGLSYMYTSSDGMFNIKKTMSVENSSIEEKYMLIAP